MSSFLFLLLVFRFFDTDKKQKSNILVIIFFAQYYIFTGSVILKIIETLTV